MIWLLSLAKDILGVVIKPITDLFAKKLDVDLEKYRVDGKLDEARLQASMTAWANMTTLGDRGMRWLFVYPLGAWWTAIIIDCIGRPFFKWEWHVLALPETLMPWAAGIIAFLFLTSRTPR